MKQTITGFRMYPFSEKRGAFGRTAEDRMLEMTTEGGAVYLRKSTLERAGGSWEALTGRLEQLSARKGIPFEKGSEGPAD